VVDEAVVWRLRRIEALQREDANPVLILAEVRELVAAAEEVMRAKEAERLELELATQD
jgi:ParB-like chromosome segregation protein Spo0J